MRVKYFEKKFKWTLSWQILLAILLGISFGTFLNHQPNIKVWTIANLLTPAGDIFIRLIKMIVIPVVISTLVVGITNIGDTKILGRIGLKTILYFEFVTTLAIIIGITLANIFKPGSAIDMSQLAKTDVSKYLQTTQSLNTEHHSLISTILSFFPSNVFLSMVHGDILPIIFFSCLFGLAAGSLPDEKKEPILKLFNSISSVMFKMTNIIMHYAPIGVFSLISITIATFGFSALFPLVKLVLLVYAAIVFFALVILGAIARFFSIPFFTLLYILKDELILAYSTATSESVLPNIIKKMTDYGAPRAVAGLVVPAGYSFNLDGSTLYQAIAAIFMAQLYGIDLPLTKEIVLVLTLMLTSKGIAGVPGVSFVVLLATLGSVGIPLDGLAFIAGVDRLLDMARTALNVVGNALAVLVISKWENVYDEKKARNYEKTLKQTSS